MSQPFNRGWIGLALALLVLGIVIAGQLPSCCEQPDDGRDMPEVLRIALLPGDSPDALRDRYTPLLERISSHLDVGYELVYPADYADILRLFDGEQIDLAFFGGVTLVLAHERSNAQPLAIRDSDMKFQSFIIARAEVAKRDGGELGRLEDFQGRRFCFGSNLSTSGHFMPRYFLTELGIVPELYFSKIVYTGAHDSTAFSVRDGDCDLGAINAVTFQRMIVDGRLDDGELATVWISPPYPDYVWSTQDSFSPEVRSRIRDAFLSLSPANEADRKILDGASGYLPAAAGDFASLAEIIRSMDGGSLDVVPASARD